MLRTAWSRRALNSGFLSNAYLNSIATRRLTTEAAGRNIAFEKALKLIEFDKNERLRMLDRVEKEIAKVSKGNSSTRTAQLFALNALKTDLQVKSELNEPEIRKNFAMGVTDMSRPVYRYLTRNEFEKAKRPKLLERINQMNVIPDLLPLSFLPVADVSIRLQEESIEPGVFVKPEQTIQLPTVQVTSFHTEPRLYTVMLVDPDSPDVESQSYQQHCHWLVSNVPLSATKSSVEDGDVVLPYVPPHPQKGTRYHRFTLIAYEQSDRVDIKGMEREQFDAKNMAEKYGLQARGVMFFRELWDESVSKIYSDVLKTHEPNYGRPSRRKMRKF